MKRRARFQLELFLCFFLLSANITHPSRVVCCSTPDCKVRRRFFFANKIAAACCCYWNCCFLALRLAQLCLAHSKAQKINKPSRCVADFNAVFVFSSSFDFACMSVKSLSCSNVYASTVYAKVCAHNALHAFRSLLGFGPVDGMQHK